MSNLANSPGSQIWWSPDKRVACMKLVSVLLSGVFAYWQGLWSRKQMPIDWMKPVANKATGSFGKVNGTARGLFEQHENTRRWTVMVGVGKSFRERQTELDGTRAKTLLCSSISAGEVLFHQRFVLQSCFFPLLPGDHSTWSFVFEETPIHKWKYDLNIFFSGGLSSFLKQDFSLPFTSGCLENKIHYCLKEPSECFSAGNRCSLQKKARKQVKLSFHCIVRFVLFVWLFHFVCPSYISQSLRAQS